MDFRSNIKSILSEKNMTQKDLARMLGVTDVSLNKSLRGEYPQLQTLERIANALEVDIVDLFKGGKCNATAECPHCGKEIEIKIDYGRSFMI